MKKWFLLLLCVGTVNAYAAGLKTVVYTVHSKTSVLADGDEPVGSMATFEQTGAGQKGQMTAGNSTTFTLTGLQGVRLHKITLKVRSNKSSGAGYAQMNVGDSVLFYIPEGTFQDWFGAYSASWVSLGWSSNQGYMCRPITDGGDGTTLKVYMEALVNSLYIESYTLIYSIEPQEAYVVNFQTNSAERVESIKEVAIGSGVVLPDCMNPDSIWRFVGWTLETIDETNKQETLPTIYGVGERFYPIYDTQMYALYTDSKDTMPNRWLQDTVFESGYYLIADSIFQQIAVGDVQSGKVAASSIKLQDVTEERLHICPLSDYAEEMVYYIDFLPDSMATIQHVETGRYIGYPATSLVSLKADKTLWNYRVLPLKQVAFYHMYGDTKREFRAMFNSNQSAFRWECTLASSEYFANILFNIADMPSSTVDVRYTSFPLGSGVNDVLAEYVSFAPWGIRNEAGLLLSLYSVDGRLLMRTHGDMAYSALQHGYYLLGVGGVYGKIFVP